MPNLPKEFFKRDLTTQEWVDLEKQLSESSKDSIRFAQLAKKFYLGLGLPNPEGPGSTGTGSSSITSIVLKTVLALSILGGISWFVLKLYHSTPEPKVLPVPTPTVQTQPKSSPVTKPAKTLPSPKAPAVAPKLQPTPIPEKPRALPVRPSNTPTATSTATPDDSPSSLFKDGFQGQEIK